MAGKRAPFPTKDQVAEFIESSDQPVGKREIARAFHIKGDDRPRLKALLRELADDGVLERSAGRRFGPPDSLPAVAVLTISRISDDGDLLAVPARRDPDAKPPRIHVVENRKIGGQLSAGDRVLAKLRRLEADRYEAAIIRKLDRQSASRIVGVFSERAEGGGSVSPADKRNDRLISIDRNGRAGASDGDLVVVLLEPSGRMGPRRATIDQILGRADDPAMISRIAIAAAGIPDQFPEAAIRQAEAAKPPQLGDRADLRNVHLVTIDDADARDFDDAVWAEPDANPANKDGWHLIVAIADVAAYVPPESALDKEARRRGNSCYFPDRVVPMLPEALSNGLCSLVPGEDRACMAVHLTIDSSGHIKRYDFVRGLMRSVARLTYEQVQRAVDGQPDDATGPLLEGVITPLYGAFRCLAQARESRGTLELDVPERRFVLDDRGQVTDISQRERLDSHRLIEEFMIAANVAAARALQDHGIGGLFRVHDAPERSRLMALRDFLQPLGYALSLGQVAQPRMFTQILARAAGRPESETVSEMVLRAQSQAVYQQDNIGHFGLALPAYVHFTSPIRRYADLMVHRALIRALGLGKDGAGDAELSQLAAIGDHLTMTERRAAAAERDAGDRYTAAYLARHVGQRLTGRVTSVTRFGLFVRLDDSGGDGLVPIRTLPDDYYDLDERSQALVGRRWGRVYQLGAPVAVRLVEANPVTGSTVLALMSNGDQDEGASTDFLPRPSASPHPARRKSGPSRGRQTRRRSRSRR